MMKKNHLKFLARIFVLLFGIIIFSRYPVNANSLRAENQDEMVYLPLIAYGFSEGPDHGNVNGTVRNARTDVPLANATVCYDGVIICTTTNSQGLFSFIDVPKGVHDFTGSADGYEDGKETVIVQGGSTTDVDFELLPNLSDGEIRVEVKWVNTPYWQSYENDLNLHVWTTYDEPKHHVFVDNPNNPQFCLDLNSEPYTCYELDKRLGSGPEAIVIANQNDIFQIAVLNENDGRPGVPSIKELEVRVQVYDESGPMLGQPLQISASGDGDLWYMFDLFFGEIELKNCLLQYVSPGDDPPLDCNE